MAGFVRVDGPTEEIRRISASLKDAPKEFRRELPRALVGSVKPVKEAAKAKAKSMPLPQRGGFEAEYRRSLVSGIVSKATSLSKNPAVRVGVISKSRAAAKSRSVGRNINNQGSIRHPVFGDRTKWSNTEVGNEGWFDEAVTAASPKALAELERRVGELMQKIALVRGYGYF